MEKIAQIRISWSPENQTDVLTEFPDNPILCAFLLSEAKKQIDRFYEEKRNKLVQPASTIPKAGI